MELRLRAGDRARAEDYLGRFADLRFADITLDLLAAEYALRNRHRPPAWPEEYLLRFPEHIRELRALLSEAGGPAGLSATRPVGSPLAPLLVAPAIPGYYVLGELGRGGMGVVYKARDLRLHRTVAVKTLAAVPTADTSARFTREAEAIARLDHPHIVPVYEVGEWQAGPTGPRVPFFVMKWYPGGSLDTAPAGSGSDPAVHARTVEAIARAVHHAHQRGVLHRDLKPSNTLLDEAGVPHVADFGLAGRFNPADPKTLTAAVVGAPAYMAPEQARSPSQVSTAADVYGLGAILYYQLTGAAPFRADTPLATLDLVANAPVPRPSAVNPAAPRDLETVCLKCLDKDPDRRYPSADEVAADLRRWLAGEPIAARPTPAWEHAWRWARRHPVVTGMGATTVVALLAAVLTLAVSFARVREEEAATAAALEQERRAKADMAAALDREQRALYLERVASAARLYAANQLPQAWALLDQCPPRFRGREWRYLDSLRRSGPVALVGHEAWVLAAAFLANGRLVSADNTGGVKGWDVARRAEQRGWRVGRGPVLAAHPARSWVAAADEKSVAVWDADTGQVVRRLEGSGRAAFGPDGSWVAATDGAVVRVWKVPSWAPAWVLAGHTDRVSCLAFDPAGGRLVTGSAEGPSAPGTSRPGRRRGRRGGARGRSPG